MTSANVASVKVVMFSLMMTSRYAVSAWRQHLSDRVLHSQRLEPSLGVDRRDTARAGRGHGLAVDVVLDVTGGEETLDVGERAKPVRTYPFACRSPGR